MEYEKYDSTENIEVGDLVSFVYKHNDLLNLWENTNKVTKSVYHRIHKNPVIGIVSNINNNIITVQKEGTIDVNVTGMISIDDKLTSSKIPGKAKAIAYPIYDEILYREVSIGKVISIYRQYDKAKVLLDIDN